MGNRCAFDGCKALRMADQRTNTGETLMNLWRQDVKTYIIVGAVAAILGSGTFVYFTHRAPDPAAAASVTAKVERGDILASVSSTGRVASNLDVDIKCKASGEVVKLPFDVSDIVKEGDLLVELDPIDMERSLTQAQVQLQASEARLQEARQNLDIAQQTLKTDQARAQAALTSAQAKAKDTQSKADRTKQLFEKKLASQEEWETDQTAAVAAQMDLTNAQTKLEELKTQEVTLDVKRQDVVLAQTSVDSDKIAVTVAQDRLHDTKVTSPMDGVVSARNVQKGVIISSGVSNVGGGTTIMTISDLSKLFVYASVDESDIGRVQLGQSVNITADAFPGVVFDGRVTRIATKGTNVSNVVTFEVQVEVLGEQRRHGSSGGGSGVGSSTGSGGASPATEPTSRPAWGGHAGGARWRNSGATSQPTTAPGAQQATGHGYGKTRSEGQTLSKRAGEAPATQQPTTQPAATQTARSHQRPVLKPEMTANVEIIVADKSDVVIVPVEAVVRKAGQQYVTVIKDDGSTQDVAITTGITDGTRMEIASGLDAGQTIQIRKGGADSRWNGQRSPGGLGGPGGMRGLIPGGGAGGRR